VERVGGLLGDHQPLVDLNRARSDAYPWAMYDADNFNDRTATGYPEKP
jgi:hypothetical protein